MKQKIRIFFTDFWEPFDPEKNVWVEILRSRHEIHITPDKPDFLFYSCFGQKHLAFDCVKICVLGENISPDFNCCDYAFGFDHMDFEDRYMRIPLYRYCVSDEPHQEYDPGFFMQEARSKKKFCNFLYSNARHASPLREQFLDRLSAYRPVDSGGRLRNNTGFIVDDKRTWQRQYKFTIAFENSCKNGYTTEKLYDALCAHTIPIYWGNPRVAEDFNPGRFISCHDFPSFDAVVERVKELDSDPARYAETLSQPWFASGPPSALRDDPEFARFLLAIVAQGPEKARRTTRHGATTFHLVDQRFLARVAPLRSALQRARDEIRKLRRILSSRV